MKLDVVILAAGKGKRMVSRKPKVMHPVMGRPMIGCVVDRALALSPNRVIVVMGHERESVEAYLKEKNVTFAIQDEQKGTAHALLTAEPYLSGGDILVLYGDVPLIEQSTVAAFVDFFEGSQGIAFMTTEVADPTGYGRVIMKGDEIERIVEHVEATEEQRLIREINTGICMLRREFLPLLTSVKADNKKGEYYLTDIVTIARGKGMMVKGYHHPVSHEVLGINTRSELLDANTIMQSRILEHHMAGGVTITGRDVYIEEGVTIGRDTVILPGCSIGGATSIGEDAVIGPNVVIRDSVVASGVVIEPFSSLDGAVTEEGVKIGPFARLRPGAVLRKNAKAGNLAGMKKGVLGDGSKAHLPRRRSDR